MSSRFFFSLIFTALSIQIYGQVGFARAVENFLSKPDYKNASLGIHVVRESSRETVYDLNSKKPLIPASTMKVLTTASALEVLGADYRFKTQLAYTGRINKEKELKGDLVLIGGGDPVLGSEHFEDHYFDFLKIWVRSVKEAGIRTITGDLILDGSVFDSEKIPDTWIWGDIGNYYGVGPSAFTVYDNLFRITFESPVKAGKPTSLIAVDPEIQGMTFQNEVLSADNRKDNAYVYGGPFDKKRVIRGTIPRNRKAFTIKAAIHNPQVVLAREFYDILLAEGVFLLGDIRFEPVNRKGLHYIFSQESPTVAEIIKVINHESINLFAEHLLKQIAVEKIGLGKRETAIEHVTELWESKGISTRYLFMEDGSGLSHFNAAAPVFFTNILSHMSSNDAFRISMPGPGKGTLKNLNSKLFPGNTLVAKSGSMTRVRCYTGYLIADSGEKLIFSIMVNHFLGSHSALIKEMEQLFVAMKSSM